MNGSQVLCSFLNPAHLTKYSICLSFLLYLAPIILSTSKWPFLFSLLSELEIEFLYEMKEAKHTILFDCEFDSSSISSITLNLFAIVIYLSRYSKILQREAHSLSINLFVKSSFIFTLEMQLISIINTCFVNIRILKPLRRELERSFKSNKIKILLA